jgi:hypothetical protein
MRQVVLSVSADQVTGYRRDSWIAAVDNGLAKAQRALHAALVD